MDIPSHRYSAVRTEFWLDMPGSLKKNKDLTEYCNEVLNDPNKKHATDSRLFNDNTRPYLFTLLLSALLVYYMVPIVYIF
jgi:hypothetical protein